MKCYFLACIFCLLCILNSCIESVDFDDNNFEKQLFVTGVLLDEQNKTKLNIQESVPVNSDDSGSVENASIMLFTMEQDKASQVLVTTDFQYEDEQYTSQDEIEVIVGNIYWIEIDLPDGRRVISKKEILKEKVEIKDFSIDGTVSFTNKESPNFYLIEFFVFDENGNLKTKTTEVINDFLFGSGETIEFESFEYIQATNKIAVNVTNLNYRVYRYYQSMIQQLENQTTEEEDFTANPFWLFSSPAANLEGNLKDDNEKSVLGFFGVHQVNYKEKEIN